MKDPYGLLKKIEKFSPEAAKFLQEAKHLGEIEVFNRGEQEELQMFQTLGERLYTSFCFKFTRQGADFWYDLSGKIDVEEEEEEEEEEVVYEQPNFKHEITITFLTR